MSVELFYSKTEIEQIIHLLGSKKPLKKTYITLGIENKLLINENNYLFIKDNLKVGIESIEWKIPLT